MPPTGLVTVWVDDLVPGSPCPSDRIDIKVTNLPEAPTEETVKRCLYTLASMTGQELCTHETKESHQIDPVPIVAAMNDAYGSYGYFEPIKFSCLAARQDWIIANANRVAEVYVTRNEEGEVDWRANWGPGKRVKLL